MRATTPWSKRFRTVHAAVVTGRVPLSSGQSWTWTSKRCWWMRGSQGHGLYFRGQCRVREHFMELAMQQDGPTSTWTWAPRALVPGRGVLISRAQAGCSGRAEQGVGRTELSRASFAFAVFRGRMRRKGLTLSNASKKPANCGIIDGEVAPWNKVPATSSASKSDP